MERTKDYITEANNKSVSRRECIKLCQMFLVSLERLEVQINHWILRCEIIGGFHKNTFDGMVKTN